MFFLEYKISLCVQKMFWLYHKPVNPILDIRIRLDIRRQKVNFEQFLKRWYIRQSSKPIEEHIYNIDLIKSEYSFLISE